MASARLTPEVCGHPLVVEAERLARTLLAPAAANVDATAVPLSNLRALAEIGLLGINGPPELGGSPPPIFRAVSEILAGADGSTWLVQSQHQIVVQLLSQSSSPARNHFMPRLQKGELLSGLAYAHLRREAERPVRVSRMEGGWRFDGMVPWYTGWGLMDIMLLAGVTDENEVVSGFVPSLSSLHLQASEPLRLGAMQGSRTVQLTINGLEMPDENEVSRIPYEDWKAADRLTAPNTNPACFGIAQEAIKLLRILGDSNDIPAATTCSDRLSQRLTELRKECYRLLDEVPPAEALPERLALKGKTLRLVVEATGALVAASGGRGMIATSTPQRLAREAMFLLVFQQNSEVRTATLDSL
jgi:hypothetical protein